MAEANTLSQALMETEIATRNYELSRDRYVHTVRADAAAKVAGSVAKRREKLFAEVEDLRLLAVSRAESRTAAVKAYALRAPTRVTTTSLLPPNAGDRVANYGVDKLFRAAVKAAEDFNEVNEILRKRRDSLEAIDIEMRTVLAQHNDDLVRFLETPDGLANAFKRDPLLGQAHARMKSAMAKRDELAARDPATESAAS